MDTVSLQKIFLVGPVRLLNNIQSLLLILHIQLFVIEHMLQIQEIRPVFDRLEIFESLLDNREHSSMTPQLFHGQVEVIDGPACHGIMHDV